MADAPSPAPAIVIKELTGEQRELRLTGRALPYRSLRLSTKQRVEIDWPPGAPVGTGTVLGPTEAPTQLNGMWKERFVAAAVANDGTTPPASLNGEAFETLADLEAAVDELTRHGQQIEFSWGKVLRQGFIDTFERNWLNEHDLEWSLSFKWISRGEPIDPVVFVTVAGMDDVATEAKKRLDDLDNVESPDFGTSDEVLNVIQEFQQFVEDAIQTVQDYFQQYTEKIISYVRAVKGIAATFSSLGDRCDEMGQYMAYAYSTELGLSTGPLGEGTAGLIGKPYSQQTEAEKLGAEVFKQDIFDVCKAIKVMATTNKDKLLSALDGDIIAQVIVQEGQDLPALALMFYGTPYEWRRIMAFNDLSGPEVEVGSLVFIPKMNPEQAGESCPGT